MTIKSLTFPNSNLTEEIWKPIPKFEGSYEVSSYGRVRSLKRIIERRRGYGKLAISERILKPNAARGYLRVCLGKQRYIHELVLLAFVGPCPLGMECRHLDGNKINNAISNLAWGTPKENGQDMIDHGHIKKGIEHPQAKLTEDAVRYIRQSSRSNLQIAKEFGVHHSTIARARNRKWWAWLD